MKVRGVAHRGFPTRFPENTLSSFQAALDLSFSHMELDVHLSKDGIPVVMHDLTINRMCNGQGNVRDYTLEELKQFRVADVETIPTLEEALSLVKGRITVLIELKQFGKLYDGLERKVLEQIRRLDMVDQVVITSFDHYALARMREWSGDIPIGLLMGGASPCVFSFMREIGSRCLSIAHDYLTEEYAEECSSRGIQLITRPIDTEQAMNKMLRYSSVLASTNCAEAWGQFYLQHWGGRR